MARPWPATLELMILTPMATWYWETAAAVAPRLSRTEDGQGPGEGPSCPCYGGSSTCMG